MATISPFTVITADGDYELETRAGHEHLLTLRGDFGGGTVTLTGYNNATGAYTSISGASWTAEADARIFAASHLIKLTLAGSADPELAVNFLPIYTR